MYVYSNGEEQRTYYPVNACLQDIGRNLQSAIKKPWEMYLKEGLMHLQVRLFWNMVVVTFTIEFLLSARNELKAILPDLLQILINCT